MLRRLQLAVLALAALPTLAGAVPLTDDDARYALKLAPGWHPTDSYVPEGGGRVTNYAHQVIKPGICADFYASTGDLVGMSQEDLNASLSESNLDAWTKYTSSFRAGLPGMTVSEEDMTSDQINGVRRLFYKKVFENAHGLKITAAGVRYRNRGGENLFFCLFDDRTAGVESMIHSVRPAG